MSGPRIGGSLVDTDSVDRLIDGAIKALNPNRRRSYAASRTKRARATKAEMERRAEALIDIVGGSRPCTVRQAYSQATVRGIVAKTEGDHDKVQRQLVDLRWSGRIPFDWIADNTRWQRKPLTFGSLAAAVERTAETYRRAVWEDLDVYCEVWLEKDALAGTLMPVTSRYDVPLMVSRGYASLSYLHEAASCMRRLGKDVVILHFGDHDPSGRDAADKIERTLRGFAPEIGIGFRRMAVTPEQIGQWGLPTRPTKATDSRSRTWTGGDSVELDAIEANALRGLLEDELEAMLPDDWLGGIRAAEESERELLSNWARAVIGDAP